MSILIEDVTPLLPAVIATGVIHEVCLAYMNTDLPGEEDVENNLCFRAQLLYDNSPEFRALLDTDGTYGRDTLYSLMRIWISQELAVRLPWLFELLPEHFKSGAALKGNA